MLVGDSTLYHQLYKDLHTYTKDKVFYIRKLNILSSLCFLTLTIDSYYSEHKNDVSKELSQGKSNSGANPNSTFNSAPNSKL